MSITDGVVAVNAQGRVTFMNHVAEQLAGFLEKESLALTLTTSRILTIPWVMISEIRCSSRQQKGL
ncbi:MAG: PAS domain-containing protein [Clostridia bacterium]